VATGVTRRRAPWLAAAVAVPVALLIVVLATRPEAATRAADSPLLGKAVPPLEGTTLDGQPFRLQQFEGRWVLVNFFATWCVPCVQEHGDLIRFHREHQRAGDADVVGVIYDDSPDAVRQFRQRQGGLWPMVVDPQGRIALDFGVSGVPESYLISPDGLVAAKVVGGVRAPALEELLARARGA
jgi:cytochrome c biogenesis protein CcmG/thiol:disulfide interchange protein DsbE